MKNWVNKMLGVKTHEPPPLSAVDDYVIVNRSELDRLIGELNNHYERNAVIEEVVQHVAKMSGFGNDTIDSLSIYIRELKR
jgi:hypothetical protein